MSDNSETLFERSLKAERELLSTSAIHALAEERWNIARPLFDWPLLILFVIAMTALFAPFGSSDLPIPALGSIAQDTIRADRSLEVADPEETTLRRAQVRSAVRPRFDYDAEFLFERRNNAISAIENVKARKGEAEMAIADRLAAFEAELGLPVNAGVFELLEGLPEIDDAGAALAFFLALPAERMVMEDRALLPESGAIELRRAGQEEGANLFHFDAIIDVAGAWRMMRAKASEAPFGSARSLRTWILQTALALTEQNVTYNRAATESAAEAALATVEQVNIHIGRGEVIVREGDRVTQRAQARLSALNEVRQGGLGWVNSVAFAVFLAGLVGLGAFFFRSGRQPLHFTRKTAYITLATIGITGFISIGAIFAGRGIAEGIGIDLPAAAYLSPVALSAVIVSIFVNARVSLMVGVALALLVTYHADGGIWLAAYYLIGVLVAGIGARHCRHRKDLLKVGAAVATVQAATVPLVLILDGGTAYPEIPIVLVIALVSGGLVAALAMVLLPLFEYVFNEITDVRLMELATGDHPLLKALALKSPGTYHHSVMIANLSEAAAEAIGANALKCRVMALYHDIGKSERPVYFAENQREGNIHDGLPPELSARIIFAHITEGIELARKHRLGRPVIEAVTQHQGTTLLRVFYQRALENAPRSGRQVDEADYRYPGPRPRTRESGILMLGDSVEAATRALSDPSPAELKERVGKVISEKMTDGQLSDCALTIADLTRIEEAFARVLVMGVYHSRIEYPAGNVRPSSQDQEHNGKDGNGDRGNDTRRGMAGRAS
ncbi:MAG: HDIG domain-containing protein [Alphaproteobacteria bacterium]|nr:HDIG domain-containing protein [Alphaproteobacteria bacterium]